MTMIEYSKGEGFTPLPEGTYDCRIDEVESTTSSKGNPQLQVSLTVVDGPYADRKPKTWYSLLPQSVWRVGQLTDALDIEQHETGQQDADGNPIMSFDTDELLGRIVSFEVTQRSYNGRINNDFGNPHQSSFDIEETGEVAVAATAATAPAKTPVDTAAEPQPPKRRRRRVLSKKQPAGGVMERPDQNSAEFQQAVQAMIAQTAGMVGAFAPQLNSDELQAIAGAVIIEQDSLGQIINDALDKKTHAKYPGWGVVIHNVGNIVPESRGEIVVPKLPHRVHIAWSAYAFCAAPRIIDFSCGARVSCELRPSPRICSSPAKQNARHQNHYGAVVMQQQRVPVELTTKSNSLFTPKTS